MHSRKRYHMKKVFLVTFFATLFAANGVVAQIYIDPGIGAIVKSPTSPRLNMGIHRIVKNKIGLVGTLEFGRSAGGSVFKSDERILMGPIFRLSPIFSIYASAGVISNGIFKDGFKLSGMRREIGVEINIPKTNLNLDLGYSRSLGLSFNLGYVIMTDWRERFLKGNFNPVHQVNPGTY